MKRVLTWLLISTVIISGISTACDPHPIDADGHHRPDSYQNSDPSLPDTHACDHCCHMSSHLTGICITGHTNTIQTSRVSGLVISTFLVSLSIEPPLRPPTA
jgi:hypothetical protein